MSTNFLSLPRELRDQTYELVLLHEEPLDPWAEIFPRQKLTTGLFRTSKTIHHETTSLFYGQNTFELSTGTPRNIASFLGQIGQSNAECIRHIHIEFPRLCVNYGFVYLDNYNFSIIANLNDGCASLSTLTLSEVDHNTPIVPLDVSPNADEISVTADPEIIAEGLKLVNTNIRAIASLQKVFVKIHEDSLTDRIRNEMEKLGWIIHQISDAESKEGLNSDTGDSPNEAYSGWGYEDGDWSYYLP